MDMKTEKDLGEDGVSFVRLTLINADVALLLGPYGIMK